MADISGFVREPLRELALFAGAGGGILGGHLLGWRCVCAVERDRYAAAVLVARQNDKSLAPFPIWDCVETFDGRPWRGLVDVISGGFPCQDVSAAGGGAGLDGERSGLWREFVRVVSDVVPAYLVVENSPMLTSRGLGRILRDLAAMGYDAQWGVLGASDAIWLGGCPSIDHERYRIWIIATLHDPERPRLERYGAVAGQPQKPKSGDAGWWSSEPDVGRMAHGLAHRMDRIRAIGNGQVPAVERAAWLELVGRVVR